MCVWTDCEHDCVYVYMYVHLSTCPVIQGWEECIEAGRKGGGDYVESCLHETAALKLCMEKNPDYYGPLLAMEEEEEEERKKRKGRRKKKREEKEVEGKRRDGEERNCKVEKCKERVEKEEEEGQGG